MLPTCSHTVSCSAISTIVGRCPVRRRQFLAAALSAPALFGKNRIDVSRLSAITDEIAKTPAEAIQFAKQYGLSWVELRSVPGARKAYYSLPEEELKETVRTLAAGGLKVSFLNT